ncbi:response regulator transcription factor [Streptomyces sp. BR1]|uniref:response regulator transcription factor n=1 Tax=Streptomyces sp. BR1 TaxID=1592323 RepID=UPI00402BCF5F
MLPAVLLVPCQASRRRNADQPAPTASATHPASTAIPLHAPSGPSELRSRTCCPARSGRKSTAQQGRESGRQEAGQHEVEGATDTTFENDEYVYEALRAGADGFLLKRARPSEIVHAVPLVAEGESLLFPAAVRSLAAEYGNRDARAALDRAALTEREAAVLKLMARGLSNAGIAARLIVGTETVKTHVSAVLAKLGARDRTQAVIAAYESGFVAPS